MLHYRELIKLKMVGMHAHITYTISYLMKAYFIALKFSDMIYVLAIVQCLSRHFSTIDIEKYIISWPDIRM